ncbi:MAG: RdgB/HAM1 family non-canonical purine NTP pyrophosphatase [Oscillospiraceae bacterium]|nr:RdgB/HAM1 family non-canonical purine NTP pyrophosphatase [Oscillospiraceae bacterium]
MKFVLATANKGKISEMREILAARSIEGVSQAEVGLALEVEEIGTTFMENALLKAQAVCAASGLPAIADDSGLMVDALGGEPGVYSSSFGGEALSDSERYAYLLKKMENMEQRDAKFVSTIVCTSPDGEIISAEGECHGEILHAPRGSGGFGYDPVFLVKGTGKSMAELSPEEKNAVSHRGAALRAFVSLLEKRGKYDK